MSRPQLAAVLLGSLAAGAGAVAAQDGAAAPPDDSPIFTEEIRVELVEIEVVVTDRQGNPVTDLEQEDFTVRIDGQPVPIANFYAVRSGGAVADAEPGADGEPAAAGREPLRLAVLVDLPGLPLGRSNRFFDRVADGLVESLRPGDELMIAAVGREFEIAQPMTTEVAAAAEVLRGVGGADAGMGIADRDLRRIVMSMVQVSPNRSTGDAGLDEANRAFLAADAAELQSNITNYARERAVEARRAIAAVETLVSHVGGLDGRRVLLYLGGGIEEVPGQALLDAWYQKFSSASFGVATGGSAPMASESPQSSIFAQAATIANAQGVTVYAMAPDNNLRAMGVSAEMGAMVSATDVAATNVAQIVGQEFDRSRGGPLGTLADRTGGSLWLGSSRFEQFIGSIVEDRQVFYSLGVSVRSALDDNRAQSVQVDVDRPRVRVRHRETVRPRSPREKAESATMAALANDRPNDSIGISFEFGEAAPAPRGRLRVPMTIRFPLVGLTYLPDGEIHSGHAAVFLAVMDREGRFSALQHIDLPIDVPSRELVERMQRLGQFDIQLEVREGWHRVAIGLYDAVADTVSTALEEHEFHSPDVS